ncbi:MAG: phosphoribosyl-ATP diphosphatase [Spirochaetaceae bacterium]|jgi:phosphoribosyl-ATP pyrophosphohydrolase/phosphoribosyl-AMP cyclohydrolase|nr:phosphoribosyl-ATP diphosphatase [Spirochaetaceae bacterium]
MADGIVLPLIVNINGASTVAALMNKKSFSKSLESKKLWILHPETNRVLPWAGEPEYLSLEKKEGFYLAELPAGSENRGFDLKNNEEDVESHGNTLLNTVKEKDSNILYKLAQTIKKRKEEMPSGSYTTHLFEKGLEKIKKKVGEETIELILAESKEDVVYESADLIYHLIVMLEERGVEFHDLMVELERRDS